jgi:hypothetical protein
MGTPVTTRSKKGLAAITLAFNESLDAGSANSAGQYTVLGGVKKKGKTVYTKVLAFTVKYDDGKHSVTVQLAKPFKGSVQVTVRAGLRSASQAASQVAATEIVR